MSPFCISFISLYPFYILDVTFFKFDFRLSSVATFFFFNHGNITNYAVLAVTLKDSGFSCAGLSALVVFNSRVTNTHDKIIVNVNSLILLFLCLLLPFSNFKSSRWHITNRWTLLDRFTCHIWARSCLAVLTLSLPPPSSFFSSGLEIRQGADEKGRPKSSAVCRSRVASGRWAQAALHGALATLRTAGAVRLRIFFFACK